MDMLFQWLLLTAAVAAGWAVGRYGNRSGRASRAIMDEDSVRDRLQFLFTSLEPLDGGGLLDSAPSAVTPHFSTLIEWQGNP